MLADPRRRAVVLIVLSLAAVAVAQVLWAPDEDFGPWFGVLFGAPTLAFGVQATLAMRELTKPGAEDRDLLRALTLIPFGVGLVGIAIAIAPAAFTVEGDAPWVVTLLIWVLLVAVIQYLGGFLVGVSFLLPGGLALREVMRRVRRTGDEPLALALLLVPPTWWIRGVIAVLAMRDVGGPTRFVPIPLLLQIVGIEPSEDLLLMWLARVVLALPLLVGISEWTFRHLGETARAGSR